MAPKKRPRKKTTTVKDQPTKHVVPPKKRRTLYDPSLYSDTSDSHSADGNGTTIKELPEWFKLSIQLLLINFYPEGVAILNNLEADYDALFKHKGANIDSTTYNFPNWETMLKSPQFKKHCLVYVDKRILYCKGLPLPRSAAITMRDGGVWEIYPKYTHPEQAGQYQNQQTSSPQKKEETGVATSSMNSNHYEEEENQSTGLWKNQFSDGEDSSDSASSLSAPRSPSLEKEGNEGMVVNRDSDRVMPTLPLVIPAEEENIVDKNIHIGESRSRTPTPTPVVRTDPSPQSIVPSPTTSSLTQEDNFGKEQQSDVSQQTGENSEMVLIENDLVDVSNDEEELSPPTKANHSPLPEPTAFFRRFDVPSSWTQVLEDHEENGGGDADASENLLLPFTVPNKPEETPPSTVDADCPLQPPSPPEEQTTNGDNSEMDTGTTVMEDELIIHDSAGSSPNPQSPSVSIPRPPSPSTPPPPILSPQIIFEKSMGERIKERRQVMRDPRKLYISNSSLRLRERGGITTYSENDITTTESSEENSTDSSPTSENSLIFQEAELMPYKCTVVDIPGLDLPYLQALEKAVDEGRVQNVHRDPRLNIGRRAAHFTFLQTGGKTGELGGEGVAHKVPVTEKKDKRSSKSHVGVENERRVALAQSSSGTNLEKNDDFPPCEPNLSITIINTNTIPRDEQRMEMFVPLERVHQFESHLFIENPIPQEHVAEKLLTCSELWNNINWKDRLKQDNTQPGKFFNSDIYEKWKNLRKRELAPRRMELIRELQKYEDKVFPSRCDFYLRTALRMVELDYRTDYQFTEPTTKNGQKLVEPDEVLFYIDFTGAPGGVVEFYNKTKKLNSKGFGVTYQKRCYNLGAIPDIYPDFFEPFYGKLNGYAGDGNLFIQETVDTFVNRVMEATDGKGVHIVSTLGNITRVVFEDGNDENWKFQHLAQTLVALLLLREGGHFALKMYELKQSFGVGLVFLLSQCFENVRICKLNIFAPTSAERVVVCLGKKNSPKIDGIIQFLQKCHKSLTEWYEKTKRKKYSKTIEELIPFGTLKKHEKFMSYIRSSNDRFKRTQIEELNDCLTNLRKRGSIFTPASYRALVARTTELWRVPSRTNYCNFKDKLVDSRNPLTSFRELRVPDNVCDSLEANLNEFNLYSIFSTTEHWRFSPVGNKIKTRGFYLGVEGIPHIFNMKTKQWIPFQGNEFRLPSRSLIYGEIVPIFTKDGSSSDEVFVIIDALVLAGVEIKNLTYSERLRECEKFAMAVTKTFFPKMSKLVVTRTFDFMQLSAFLEGVVATPEDKEAPTDNNSVEVKQTTNKLRIPANSVYKLRGRSKEDDLWFSPSGILFFEAGSNSRDFCSSLLSRIFWEWVETGMDIPLPKPNSATDSDVNGTGTTGIEELRPIGSVSAKKLIDFAHRYSQV